jgi:hypothetical protein
LQLAFEIHRNKQQGNDDATEHITENELQKLEISVARKSDSGNGNKRNGRSLRRHNRSGNRPPRHVAVADEIIVGRFLFRRKPDAE